MRFDLTTAMTITSLLTFGVGASLAFAVSRYPFELRAAMRVWIGGLFLQTLALLAIAVVGPAPGAGVIVVSNTIYALAFAEMGRAQTLFAGRRRSLLPLALVGCVATISFLFAFVWPHTSWRLALNAWPLAALQFAVANAILRERRELRPADRLTASLFIACAVLAISRAIVEALGPVVIGPGVREASNQIVYVFSPMLPIIATIGFMLMCSDRLSDDLARLAMLDPLTGVYNRRTLAGLAAAAIGDAQRERKPFALLAIDVDHFKSVNDEYGHDTGDEALRGLVGLLRDSLQSGHVLARIGGEEFAVLLPGCDEDAGREAAECMRLHIATSPLTVNGHLLRMRVSIGVAALGDGVTDLGALLREADRALYAAKRAGRDRVATRSSLAAGADRCGA
jgi:diguanylate cyclase (GGDEF)-like protein